MYRLILACLDLDADGKSSPGRLRTHDLESFDFRHITFNDVLMPFEQSETINFGYGQHSLWSRRGKVATFSTHHQYKEESSACQERTVKIPYFSQLSKVTFTL